MKLPPRIIRRLILDPGIIIVAVLVVWFWPFVVLGVVIISLIPRVGRVTRILAVLLFYIVLEGMAMVALFAIWVAAGFGHNFSKPAFVRAHYRLMAFILRWLFRFGQWSLKLEIVYEGAGPGTLTPDIPLIVASRHAGLGDSFIVINALLNDFDRYPRIVMKDTLQWDPMIDVVMNRLPMVFLSPTPFTGARVSGQGAAVQQAVANLAATMGPRDGLALFPEGGNFSLVRRDSRIRQLEESGKPEFAQRASRLQHLLAPRPGGLFAAVGANRNAGVVFVGHTGLEKLDTPVELWRSLPTDKKLVMKSWFVAPEQIPTDATQRQSWLFDWWETIDLWIGTTDIAER